MQSYELIFPEYLDDYEHETESKGYLVGVKVLFDGGKLNSLSMIQRGLLRAQEIGDEIGSSGYFVEARLVVVPKVTRDEISSAVEKMSVSGFQELRSVV